MITVSVWTPGFEPLLIRVMHHHPTPGVEVLLPLLPLLQSRRSKSEREAEGRSS
jgi:hypothetical protein